MSTDLLNVGEMNTKKCPLMMEFRINPETSPFLVSSSKALLWVSPRSDKIRAASRVINLPGFFMECVHEIADTGLSHEWGNVQSWDDQGWTQAIEHVKSYGFDSIEILAAPNSGLPDVLHGTPVEEADWLEDGYAVVVPTDRDYVGFLLRVTNGMGLAVLHNSSRAVSVVRKHA